MLRGGDVAAGAAQAGKLRRRRDAQAVEIARRQARGARQADEQRIQVGALAAQVLRLEHASECRRGRSPCTSGSRTVFSTIQS